MKPQRNASRQRPLLKVSVWLPALTILVIAGCYCMMFRDQVFLCDDIAYSRRMYGLGAGWKAYPIMMHLHWLRQYSRMAEMLAPAFMEYTSGTTRGVLMALMAGLFFALPQFFCRFRKSPLFWRTLFIALMAFTLRWDSLWNEYIGLINNVWTSVLCFLALLLIVRKGEERDRWWEWLLMPLALIAGWMHEAAGLPMALGVAVWLLAGARWKGMSPSRRALAAVFILGALLTLTSPESYNRLSAEREPLWEILLGSAYYPLLLAALLIVLAFCAPGFLKRISGTPWLIFAVAGVAGIVFPIAAGFGGRPGWFCQLFSLTALMMMAAQSGWGIPKGLSAVLSAILTAIVTMHYIGLEQTQRMLTAECHEMVARLRNSRDGVIFMDYTPDKALPWWTMHKAHGVPDDDDFGYRWELGNLHGEGNPLVVLPEAARSIDFARLDHPVKIGDSYISPYGLDFPVKRVNTVRLHRRLLDIGGTEMVETPFTRDGRHFLIYTPVDFDRGDR